MRTPNSQLTFDIYRYSEDILMYTVQTFCYLDSDA